jgi:hypothetical protein
MNGASQGTIIRVNVAGNKNVFIKLIDDKGFLPQPLINYLLIYLFFFLMFFPQAF